MHGNANNLHSKASSIRGVIVVICEGFYLAVGEVYACIAMRLYPERYLEGT
jgi:hypothetical protein